MKDSVLADDKFLGKVAVVTGACCGIGMATAMELVRLKAKVILLVRSKVHGEEAMERLEAYPGADIQLEVVDLSLVSSVVEFCNRFSERVDILINNAGVFGPPYERTEEGVELVMATNHLGHFVLTCLMLARGMFSLNARIILLTGSVYKRGSLTVTDWDKLTPKNYRKMQAFSNSKLAVCLFGLWLRSALKQLLGTSAKVFVVFPGIVDTDISRHILTGCLLPFKPCLRGLMRLTMMSPLQGCQCILMCAADHDSGHKSGTFFHGRLPEAWHKPILNDSLVLRCWDFSFELAQRTIKDPAVIGQLRKLRNLSRDPLEDLAEKEGEATLHIEE